MDENIFKSISTSASFNDSYYNYIDVTNLVGKIINKYKCTKMLGKGKFGTVYIASKDDHLYVLKIVDKKHFNKNEIDILKKVSYECHDYKASYVEEFNIYNYIVIVTDYLENSIDLFEYIERIHDAKYLKDNNITDYIIQSNIILIIQMLLQQLECLHTNNIVHMDIKPENILVVLNSQFMITYATFIDFGLSCTKDMFDKSEGALCKNSGTLEYMAPELINLFSKINIKNTVSNYGVAPLTLNNYKKTDIWSLGLVFYLLITNHFPYELVSTQFNDYHHIIYYYKNMPDIKISIIHGLTEHVYLYYKHYYDYLQILVSNMLKYNPSNRVNPKILKQYI